MAFNRFFDLVLAWDSRSLRMAVRSGCYVHYE